MVVLPNLLVMGASCRRFGGSEARVENSADIDGELLVSYRSDSAGETRRLLVDGLVPDPERSGQLGLGSLGASLGGSCGGFLDLAVGSEVVAIYYV